MIGYTIIDDDKLATFPLISAGIGMHKCLKLLDKLWGYLTAVGESYSLAIAIPLIDPSGVCCEDLIIESFASIGGSPNGREDLGAYLAIK
jgi:hypothetical protein